LQRQHHTISSTHPDDETRPIEHEQAIESLTAALETEESSEKNYHVRQALQLLACRSE
jgi:hypothetical protein